MNTIKVGIHFTMDDGRSDDNGKPLEYVVTEVRETDGTFEKDNLPTVHVTALRTSIMRDHISDLESILGPS